jgi:two-component system NarL family sensor kinase
LKATRHTRSSRSAVSPASVDGSAHQLTELRGRLAEAEETLRAIRSGEVDAVVVAGNKGPQVFTLEGAGQAYRVLIESMNEGALTLSPDGVILYANQCFARMVKHSLEQVTGSSFRRFLSADDRSALHPLLKRADKSGSKVQVLLNVSDGSHLPVQISTRPLSNPGANRATLGLVVTDMTEARRNEEMLRALSQRVIQAQETERRRVALELHDHITQLLCAILVRSQMLVNHLSARAGPAKQEAMKLRELLGQTADEVERISRNLRPSLLDELGLVAVLRDTSTKFATRTGLSLKLACVNLSARLPANTELSLYRILQEALKNVEMHAHAHRITVSLKQQGPCVELTIQDDGIAFDPDHYPTRRKGKRGLGLLSMRERATYVGGTLGVKSDPRTGTEIVVRVPLPPGIRAIKGKSL